MKVISALSMVAFLCVAVFAWMAPFILSSGTNLINGENQTNIPPLWSLYIICVATIIYAVIALQASLELAEKLRTTYSILSVAITIGCFAGIFHSYGLQVDGLAASKSESLYFSIVTFTTLGYGDIQPEKHLRLIAALEAVIGYIYLGILVSAIFQDATRKASASKSTNI